MFNVGVHAGVLRRAREQSFIEIKPVAIVTLWSPEAIIVLHQIT